MRNRLLVIILLVVWIGQTFACAPDRKPGLGMPCRAVWRPTENLAELVVYQVSHLMPWPPPRTHSRRKPRRCGDLRLSRPKPPEDDDKKDEESRPAKPPEEREDSGSASLFEPQRWGLSPDLTQKLPERLSRFWQRYFKCFKTKTRNTGEYAYHYLSCLLRMETKRNYTNIGRAAGVAGENIQHFMSNSPWSVRAVLEQVQDEIKATPGLERGSVLILDESADEKAGDGSAGAGRQHNGRLGKVEMSQVGVFLTHANLTHVDRPMWTWVDGELYLCN